MGQLTEETILRIERERAAREAERQARMAGLPPDPVAVAMQRHAATVNAVREHADAVWGPMHQGLEPAPAQPARPDWDRTIWFEINRSNVGLSLVFILGRIVAEVGMALVVKALAYIDRPALVEALHSEGVADRVPEHPGQR